MAGVWTSIVLRDEAWSLMGRPSTSTVCVEDQYTPTPHSWQAEAGVEAVSGNNPIERLLVGDTLLNFSADDIAFLFPRCSIFPEFSQGFHRVEPRCGFYFFELTRCCSVWFLLFKNRTVRVGVV